MTKQEFYKAYSALRNEDIRQELYLGCIIDQIDIITLAYAAKCLIARSDNYMLYGGGYVGLTSKYRHYKFEN